MTGKDETIVNPVGEIGTAISQAIDRSPYEIKELPEYEAVGVAAMYIRKFSKAAQDRLVDLGMMTEEELSDIVEDAKYPAGTIIITPGFKKQFDRYIG